MKLTITSLAKCEMGLSQKLCNVLYYHDVFRKKIIGNKLGILVGIE